MQIKFNLQYFGGRGAGSGIHALFNRTTAQDKVLQKIAKRTANLKKEQLRFVDKDGNVLLQKQGEQDAVHYTVGEAREFLNGNISIHNHPDGGTFSPEDISDFGYGAKEITVAAPEGTYRLINTKVGTKDQYKGWVDLQEGAKKVRERQRDDYYNSGSSSLSLLKKAQENVAKSKEAKEVRKISEKWASIRQKQGNEAADKYYKSVETKYNALNNKLKSMREAEQVKIQKQQRKEQLKPFEDYYKKNAAKYGFKYVFEPTK